VVEFCLAKWWANIGLLEAQYTITFQGLLPNPSRAFLNPTHISTGSFNIRLDTGDKHFAFKDTVSSILCHAGTGV
jgi:hypothetical protein